jgi:hypothetical protein
MSARLALVLHLRWVGSTKEGAVKNKKMAKSKPKSLPAKALSQNQAKRVKGGTGGGGGTGKVRKLYPPSPA